jgi:trk system potassium uptake protein TrkH
MNRQAVGYGIGKLMQIMGGVLLIPLGIGVYHCWGLTTREIIFNSDVLGFIIAITLSFVLGTLISLKCKTGKNIQLIGEGFAIVTFGWILLTLLGCIPLLIHLLSPIKDITFFDVVRTFTDSYFETMSGFTTTGATIITDIEKLPPGILFWRSLTHWLGGMGIVTLALVIFPAMGVSGYQMFKGEVPGPETERLQPRLSETAKILWGVYALLSLAETALLCLGGMPLYDSLCHTFGTMATGGFSTQNGSIAAYNSSYFDWVIIVFMYFAGVNFIIHYRVFIQGSFRTILKDREFLLYTGVILAVIMLFTLTLHFRGIPAAKESAKSFRSNPLPAADFKEHVQKERQKISTFYGSLRHSAFQVVSITTTTGFSTADFDTWPVTCRFVLVVMMFLGGCAGSTGGGIKMIRVLVVIKAAWREMRKMLQPRLVLPLKVNYQTIGEHQIVNIMGFFALFIGLFLVSVILMCFFVPDFVTALTTVSATICNIGPGLSGIGAVENYAWIPLPGKWILIFCMLLGRLEIFTVIIAFRLLLGKK